MALDFFEVVLEVEEAFDISMREADWPEGVSVGNLYDAVLAALRVQRAERFMADAAYADRVWLELGLLLQEQLGLRLEQITPEARFYYELGFH